MKDMEKKIIAINMHTLKSDLDNKDFYITTRKKLLNEFNKKKSISIPNL